MNFNKGRLIIFVIQFEIFPQYFRPIDFHCGEVDVHGIVYLTKVYSHYSSSIGRIFDLETSAIYAAVKMRNFYHRNLDFSRFFEIEESLKYVPSIFFILEKLPIFVAGDLLMRKKS